jgi:hypothetical protein
MLRQWRMSFQGRPQADVLFTDLSSMRRVAAEISGSASIPISARQAADLTASKTPISGGVTVYESLKSTVYRQVYRHQTVDLAGFDETTVDSRFAKRRIISMI